MKKIKLILGILFAFFILTTAHAADLTLTGNVATGGYFINGSILTQGTTTVNTGANVELIAQNTIKFFGGFKVMPGASLKAAISPDTDGDLILDLVEKRSNCENYQLADTDGEGLSDSAEDINRNGIQDAGETCACNKDTDGDKMDDKWEKDNGLDPVVNDANLDKDGDRLTNYMEYYFKSNPNSSTNTLPKKGSYYEYDALGRIKKIIRIK